MQDQQWNKLPLNQIAKRLLIQMDKGLYPEIMHATQFLIEYLQIPVAKRGRIGEMWGGEETIGEVAAMMPAMSHQQQATMFASSWEGGNLEERLEYLAEAVAGKEPKEAFLVLLESLGAHLEQE